MSMADLERFADDVRKNQALQEELKGKEVPALLEFATRRGYAVTPEDFIAYARAQNPELAHAELDAISAGAPFAGSTTRIDPYKNFKFQ